ncbi:PaREP1 family protein [Acidianus ambivalens]|uniref:Superfamily I DNA and RNA helicase and helicaseubunit n=1 Tax=Acidianus ambivalens TaxID=2283 RepID=A0A650CTQ2_ACIAM|nr:PaREP1 family protein [Acidianus ambivalens]MQL56243.1 superfamily I DNA and RNA helicase and helicaseubunit [Acidianus ambivalens]QGR21220.1 superfamily I DNA and RNA helicase and helicaseubunit [Acidianus ambivalens]
MEELIKKAEEKGIDVEDLIILALSKEDPSEGIKMRIELAKKYMNEAEEYLKKGDAVQASEKAYKAAEEVVKALAEKFNTQEQALKEGRWYTYLLSKAANALSSTLGDKIIKGWSSAYLLHVWGFHEAKLGTKDITSYINAVKEMLEEAGKYLS